MRVPKEGGGVLAVAWIAAAGAASVPSALPRDSDLQAIIVTGERVKRSLKETPSSVTVASAADIERLAGADRIEQVLEMVPNVQFGSAADGPTIRGQDTTGAARDLYAFLGGTRPRTTVIVDGRPVSFSEYLFGITPLWDVERVEVFRSPQTTTQGRYSIAGAIFIQTEDPAMRAEARGRAIAGKLHTRQASAAVSSPLIADQLALRVTGDYRYAHAAANIRDAVPGADADHDEYGVARVKLLATPKALPRARLELTYSHSQSEMPQSEFIQGPDFRKRENLTGFASIFRTNVDSLTATMRYELSPEVVADAVVTGGDSEMRRFALPGFGQTQIRLNDWYAEAVMRWSPRGPMSVVGGVSRAHQYLRQHIEPLLAFGEGGFRDWQDGTGLFAEVSWALSPKATLTAGLRYQQDRQKRVGALAGGAAPTILDFDRTFDAWLPKASFAYDFAPSLRAGVLVQRAYNPGGVTLRGDIGAVDVYEAESLWDYELFARATFAEGKIRTGTNLFYYAMRDAQRAQPYFARSAGFADMFNVPKARSYGLEAQVEWRPNRKFSGTVGLGLLRTRIVEADPAYASFEGNEFQRSPHLTATAAVEWRPIERLLISAQARHNSGYWSDESNDPGRRISGWTRVDARAEWTAGRFKLFGYARNLFDKFYLTSLFTPVSGTAGDPRQAGIGIESRF